VEDVYNKEFCDLCSSPSIINTVKKKRELKWAERATKMVVYKILVENSYKGTIWQNENKVGS
jgi:hypothetical protein